MAAYRLLFLIVLAVSLASVHSASKKPSKSLTIGSRTGRDHLLQREFEKVPSKLLRTVKLKKTYSGDKRSRISAVKLLDQNGNGNGATATVTHGGPGATFVTVDFKSAKGHSIDFIVELYGY